MISNTSTVLVEQLGEHVARAKAMRYERMTLFGGVFDNWR